MCLSPNLPVAVAVVMATLAVVTMMVLVWEGLVRINLIRMTLVGICLIRLTLVGIRLIRLSLVRIVMVAVAVVRLRDPVEGERNHHRSSKGSRCHPLEKSSSWKAKFLPALIAHTPGPPFKRDPAGRRPTVPSPPSTRSYRDIDGTATAAVRLGRCAVRLAFFVLAVSTIV